MKPLPGLLEQQPCTMTFSFNSNLEVCHGPNRR
jgi:hypothetical protein